MSGEITLEMLMEAFSQAQRIIAEREIFPAIPNPADVHPELWEALMKRCVLIGGTPVNHLFGIGWIVLHVRTDVPNWCLNECTCHRVQNPE